MSLSLLLIVSIIIFGETISSPPLSWYNPVRGSNQRTNVDHLLYFKMFKYVSIELLSAIATLILWTVLGICPTPGRGCLRKSTSSRDKVNTTQI